MPTARPRQRAAPLRGSGAVTFATAALALAATAHVVGGGALPSWPALALLVVPLAWGAVALTGRRRGGPLCWRARWARPSSLLHEAFMVLAGPACAAPGGARRWRGCPAGSGRPGRSANPRSDAGDARTSAAAGGHARRARRRDGR